MIDDAKLTEWQALCDAATPGPWVNPDGYCVRHDSDERWLPVCFEWRCCSGNEQVKSVGQGVDDMEFIAAARTALPEAIVEIMRLRALVPAWRPIETAPRDMTDVVGFHPEMSAHETYFYPHYPAHGGWIYFDGDEERLWSPTHWMPMPTPPEAP